MGKTGAVFDLVKLSWMNSQYLKEAPLETLLPLVQEALKDRGWWKNGTDPIWAGRVVDLYKSRVDTIDDLCTQAQGLFTEQIPFDDAAVQLRLKQPQVADRLKTFADRLENLKMWDTVPIETACRALAEELKLKAADLIHPTRVAVTGRSVGPSLFHVLQVAGKERVITRLASASSSLCPQ